MEDTTSWIWNLILSFITELKWPVYFCLLDIIFRNFKLMACMWGEKDDDLVECVWSKKECEPN